MRFLIKKHFSKGVYVWTPSKRCHYVETKQEHLENKLEKDNLNIKVSFKEKLIRFVLQVTNYMTLDALLLILPSRHVYKASAWKATLGRLSLQLWPFFYKILRLKLCDISKEHFCLLNVTFE